MEIVDRLENLLLFLVFFFFVRIFPWGWDHDFIFFLYMQTWKITNKQKNFFCYIARLCCPQSCLRRHRSCVNSLVRDDLESRTRGKKKKSFFWRGFYFDQKEKKKKKCATSRVISTHREMECENRRMCVHSKGVSLWPVFLFYCVSFDWLWRGRKWNKKRIEIQATEEKAALLKAFETNDKRGTKCAKVDCFLFFKKRTLSLKHLFFYRLYNRTVSFFGRRNLNMVTRTHTYRCVTASKNNPLTIVGC